MTATDRAARDARPLGRPLAGTIKRKLSRSHLRKLFADDPWERDQQLTLEAAGIYFDYSNRITDETPQAAGATGRGSRASQGGSMRCFSARRST